MISENLKAMTAKLKKQGLMYFLPGASTAQIAAFEAKTGVALPRKFKEWLEFTDGGELYLPGGVQFYGVAHKPFIDVNDPDRLNENYVVIGAMASGDPILFEKGTEKVSIYNHEAGRIEPDETFEDFFAFVDGLYDLLEIGG